MTYTAPTFRNAPTAYLRANGLLNKAPIYIISFGPITGPLGTNYSPLADEYCTGLVQNPTKIRKQIVSFPSGVSSDINPITYASTLSSIKFDLMDNNLVYPQEATKLITSYTLKNRIVTVKRGFQTINEEDYETIYTGQINDVYMNSKKTGYTFEVIDPRKQLIGVILAGHTAIVSDYTAGELSIACSDVSQFAPSSTPPAGSFVTPYLKMGDNFYTYDGILGSGSIPDGGVVWSYVGPGGFSSSYAAPQHQHAYIPGDKIYSGGGNWNCIISGYSNLNSSPYGVSNYNWGSSWWAWMGYNTTDYVTWQPNTNVSAGQTCSTAAGRYICIQSGTTSNNNPPASANLYAIGGTITNLAFVQPDGQGGSPDANQSAGTNVDNVAKFSGHPMDIILSILLSTGNGTNYSGTGTNYDVNPPGSGMASGSPYGIGIPWQQVNIANFEAQKAAMNADFGASITFTGYFKDEEQALKFIEAYILPVAHISLFINREGQIDCRAVLNQDWTLAATMTGAVTLDQSNIVETPDFKANLQTGGYFYNQTQFSYDYQLVQEYYENIAITSYAASYLNYMEISELDIDARFLTTALNGAALVAYYKNIYLRRFGFPPPIITCKTFDMMSLLNPFDPVILNHPAMPVKATGKRGGIINCQCLKVEPDWATGAMTVTLMALGWYDPPPPPLVVNPPTKIDFILIAGGGGGGSNIGGGGGAGGYIILVGQQITPSTTYPVVIGTGGAGSTVNVRNGDNGSDSKFYVDPISLLLNTAKSGGGGANYYVGLGNTGGSGGGGSMNVSQPNGGGATSGQGHIGGNGATSSYGSGGGGGGSFAGNNGTTGQSGAGGNGITSSLSGASVQYCGGGGGGGWSPIDWLAPIGWSGSTAAGNGGAGGGGNGAYTNGAKGDDATSYGSGGGGGAAGVGHGGNGSSGILIISYPSTGNDCTGGTITHVNGKTIHTFTSDGDFVVPAPILG